MEEQNQQAPQESKPFTPTSNVGKWSWGAFMFDPAFVLAIKNYKFLFVYLLYFIPFINFFAMLGVKIYLGLNGRAMAERSPMFANADEQRGYMKGIDHAGKIIFFLTLALIVIGLFFVAVFGTMLASMGMDLDKDFERQMEDRIEQRIEQEFGGDIDIQERR